MKSLMQKSSWMIISLTVTVLTFYPPLAAAKELVTSESSAVHCDDKENVFNAVYPFSQSDAAKPGRPHYPDVGEEAERLYTQGIICFREGNYDHALSLFDSARNKTTEADTRYYLAVYYLGVTYGKKGNYKEAITHLDEALTLVQKLPKEIIKYADREKMKKVEDHPGFHAIHQDLGVAHYQQKDYDQALSHLQQATTGSPSDRFTYYYQGLAHYHKGLSGSGPSEYETAAEAFKKVIEIERQMSPIQRDASDVEPRTLSETASYYLSLTYLKLGRFEEAKRTARSTSQTTSSADRELAHDLEAITAYLVQKDQREKPWQIHFGVGSEFDSNVILQPGGNTPAFRQISHQGDYRFVFTFGARYDFHPTPTLRITPSYDFYQNVYTGLSSFELQAHFLRVAAEQKLPSPFFSGLDLFVGLEGGANFYRLGQKDYLQELYVMPSLSHFWGSVEQPTQYTSISYRVTNENYRISYFDPARDGWLHEAMFRHYFLPFENRFESCTNQYFLIKPEERGICMFVGYQFSHDNPSLHLGDDFQYTGHRAEIGAHIPVLSRLLLDLTYSFRNADYAFPNSRSGLRSDTLLAVGRSDAGPRFARARDDDTHNLTVSWRIPFTLRERQFPLLEFKASYYWTFNRSNINVFQYHRHVGSLGFEVVF